MKRWRRASRIARLAVLQTALAPACLFVLSAFYCWALCNPLDAGRLGYDHGRLQFMEAIVRSPHLYLRGPVDVAFAVLFFGFGILLLKGVTSPFALDAWKPPLEDRTKSDRFR